MYIHFLSYNPIMSLRFPVSDNAGNTKPPRAELDVYVWTRTTHIPLTEYVSASSDRRETFASFQRWHTPVSGSDAAFTLVPQIRIRKLPQPSHVAAPL